MNNIPRKKRILISAVLGLFLVLLAEKEERSHASSPAALTLGVTRISEGHDFATRELGQPWNMNGDPYPDFFTALKNVSRSRFEITPDGMWALESLSTDPRIWLHWTGVGTTQTVLKMGDTIPIDASKYKLVSYYMCLDHSPSPLPGQDDDWAALVYWMYDRTTHDDPANGFTNFILFKHQGLFKTPGDCHVLTFDLSNPATWATGSWNNNPRMPMGLRLDPLNKPGMTFRIGWARLTTIDTSNKVPLTWNNAPAGNIEFYASLTACNQDGILIGRVNNASSSGTFQWGAQLQPGFSPAHPLPIPESFEPGDYHIYMKDSAGGVACANTPLEVHAAPILEFQQPSFYSGPDYATEVVSDPWGMSNSADISSYSGMTAPSFNDGVMSATSTTSDPKLFLNIHQVIDTSKYRFATFRMRIAGQQSEAGDGWVQRFIWWYAGPAFDSVTTQDMEAYEGWHTYTIDLKTAGTENCSSNCWSGFPTAFRLDPHEAPFNTQFWLDFVLLTGIDSVVRGSTANIHYTLPNKPGATVSFFYDTDKNPANGRTPLEEYVAPVSPGDDPLAVFLTFLPLLQTPGEIDMFSSSRTFVWDTRFVPLNTYYISADVNDGFMTTTWYTQATVIIK